MKIAIECGNLSTKNRIKELKKDFDVVIHLPYTNLNKSTILLDSETIKRIKTLWEHADDTYDKVLNRMMDKVA